MSNILTAEKENIRLKLYKDGYSDDEIAKIVGVHTTTITSWRKKNKLKYRGYKKICENPECSKEYMGIKSQKWCSKECKPSYRKYVRWMQEQAPKKEQEKTHQEICTLLTEHENSTKDDPESLDRTFLSEMIFIHPDKDPCKKKSPKKVIE